jgi:two-component system CheB/CheR fusion protein
MILGSAENEYTQPAQFVSLDAKLKIYKRSETREYIKPLDFPSSFSITMKNKRDEIKHTRVTENVQTLADQVLLQRFAPASVLINADGDILYCRSDR